MSKKKKSSCNGILLLLIILFQCSWVSLRPKCTFFPSMGTESNRSLLFLMFEEHNAHNGSFHLQEHMGRCEGVTLRRVQAALCMYCPGCRCDPDCGDWRGKKRVKQALGTDKGKDTKVGGREVSLSWHRGFFGWMWQPLCCLMSPRHGWRIAGERCIWYCWHHTAAQGGIDVCWQLWLSQREREILLQ